MGCGQEFLLIRLIAVFELNRFRIVDSFICVHAVTAFSNSCLKSLFRSWIIVEVDHVFDASYRVQLGFEPIPMHALFVDRSDDPLEHCVLLKGTRGDEFLLRVVAANQMRIMATRNIQPII